MGELADHEPDSYPQLTLRDALLRYALEAAVVVLGLIYRSHRIRHVIGWASLTLVGIYLLNAFVQFRFGG
ncbi:MAG: hypothetical protein WCA32_06750 [Chromatiaceae bacterium]